MMKFNQRLPIRWLQIFLQVLLLVSQLRMSETATLPPPWQTPGLSPPGHGDGFPPPFIAPSGGDFPPAGGGFPPLPGGDFMPQFGGNFPLPPPPEAFPPPPSGAVSSGLSPSSSDFLPPWTGFPPPPGFLPPPEFMGKLPPPPPQPLQSGSKASKSLKTGSGDLVTNEVKQMVKHGNPPPFFQKLITTTEGEPVIETATRNPPPPSQQEGATAASESQASPTTVAPNPVTPQAPGKRSSIVSTNMTTAKETAGKVVNIPPEAQTLAIQTFPPLPTDKLPPNPENPVHSPTATSPDSAAVSPTALVVDLISPNPANEAPALNSENIPLQTKKVVVSPTAEAAPPLPNNPTSLTEVPASMTLSATNVLSTSTPASAANGEEQKNPVLNLAKLLAKSLINIAPEVVKSFVGVTETAVAPSKVQKNENPLRSALTPPKMQQAPKRPPFRRIPAQRGPIANRRPAFQKRPALQNGPAAQRPLRQKVFPPNKLPQGRPLNRRRLQGPQQIPPARRRHPPIQRVHGPFLPHAPPPFGPRFVPPLIEEVMVQSQQSTSTVATTETTTLGPTETTTASQIKPKAPPGFSKGRGMPFMMPPWRRRGALFQPPFRMMMVPSQPRQMMANQQEFEPPEQPQRMVF